MRGVCDGWGGSRRESLEKQNGVVEHGYGAVRICYDENTVETVKGSLYL
jgi:hypothetical protein